MKPEYMKMTIASLWVLAMCAAGWVTGVASVSGWLVLGCLAVLPPIVMLRLWHEPPQSMSESIQAARR